MESAMSQNEYQKVIVDNAVCKRRFHLVYETQGKNENKSEVACPHCGVIIFSEENHPLTMLAREENLVKNPDGSKPIVYECKFIP